MKTLIDPKLIPAYLIDIIYTMPDALSVTNTANKFKLSQEELIEYNDFIESAVSIILNDDFYIIDERQNVENYSHYITFYPTDEDGQKWDELVQIRFRIANHSNKGDESQDSLSSRRADRARTKHFELGTEKYPGKIAIYRGVREVCNNLRYGDYSDFDWGY